jgi:hypothetical protein
MNEVAEPHPVPDDGTVGADDVIYRRVRDDGRVNVVTDKNGNRVASSAAFEDDTDGISVFLHSTLVEAQLEPASVIDGFEGYVLAKLNVEAIRGLAMGIVRDPNPPNVKPMPCNIAHCLLKLRSMSITQNHKLRQKLAGKSTLV